MAVTNEDNKQEKVMFEEPNYYEKRIVRAQFILGQEAGHPLMDTDEIIQMLSGRIQRGYRGFRELYLMADIAPLLHHPNIETGKRFTCIFFGNKKYQAWFHTSANGITRYYTQSPGGQHKIRLDLIDLVGMHLGYEEKKDMHAALKTMLPFAELLSSEQEQRRLQTNLVDFIHYAEKNPGMIKPEMVALYKVMIQYAQKRIYDGRTAIAGQSLFFLSVDKATDELLSLYGVDLPRSTVSSYMTWFVTLGLIHKVKPSQMPESLQERRYNESIVNYTSRKDPNTQKYFLKNEVTYFVVPSFSHVREKAERRCARLKKWGLAYHSLTKNAVSRVFGREYAEMVFPNQGKVKTSKYTKEKKAFVKKFYSLLVINGFVLKSQLQGICTKAITDKLWTQLSKQTQGCARKMSQTLHAVLGTMGEGAVFMKYSVLNPYLPVKKEAFNDEKAYETYLDSIRNVIDEWLAKWVRRYRELGTGLCGNPLALIPEGGA